MSKIKEIIKTENLTFLYKQGEESEPLQALAAVSLQIEEGSFTAIIGQNGSGKSTFGKNLNALLLPSEGVVFVDGMNTAEEENLWEIRQTAGMVFQNPDNQLVSAIVEDDVAFGPENLGIEPGEIRKRVDSSLYAVNMFEKRKSAPHLLSGGQKQRIAIAGVVAMKPKCIIMDEPTAMLDPNGRREVMDIIKQLHRERITIILITHFMEEAAEADRIIIMDQGKVALEGTPKVVFQNVKEIQAMGLDVPLAVELAEQLREKGFPVPKDIIKESQLAEYLFSYKAAYKAESLNSKG